ncbi:DUF4113 domain-containing protein [Hymenobacter sp. BT730]
MVGKARHRSPAYTTRLEDLLTVGKVLDFEGSLSKHHKLHLRSFCL